MNCYVVNINFDKDNIYGQYSNEEIKAPDGTCDTDKLETKYLVVDLKLYEITNAEGTEWNKTSLGAGLWTKKDVMLIAEIKEEMKNKVSKITFISTIEEEERIVTKDYNNKNKKKISAVEIMNTRYIVEVETKEKDENGEEIVNTYRAQIKVKIDKQRPVIYDGEIKVEKEDEWTNQSKKIKIVASDGEGSGIYGFSISEERDCNKAVYKVSSSNNDTYEIEAEKNGRYYICAKDKVGNVSEEISSKVIEINNIDKTPPKCVWSGENTTWTANDITITLTGEDESGSDSIIKKSYKEGATKTDNLKFVISDKAGNETVCEKTVNVYVDKVVPTKPKIDASDELESGKWHKIDHTLIYSGGTNLSGNTYYYGTNPNPTTRGSRTAMNTNTTGTTYYVQSCSGAGLCSGNSTYVEKLDKVVPPLPTIRDVSYGIGSGGWHKNAFTISFSGANNISGNQYFYDTSPNPYRVGTSTTISSNTVGTTYYVKVCSGAGLCNGNSVYVARLDTIKPTCITSGEGTNWVQSRTINYGCQDTLSGCQSGTGTSRSYTTTMKTTTSPQYTITDNAGNQAICGAKTVNVYVDRDAPTISFSLPSGNTFNEVKSLDISADDNNASGVNKIEYQVSFNGANRGSVTSNGNRVNGISLNEAGKYTITARALDNAGNWSNWYTAEYEISLGLKYGPFYINCEPRKNFYGEEGKEPIIEYYRSKMFSIDTIDMTKYKNISITITTKELSKGEQCACDPKTGQGRCGCWDGFNFWVTGGVDNFYEDNFIIGMRDEVMINGGIAGAHKWNYATGNSKIEYDGITKNQTDTRTFDISSVSGTHTFGFRCFRDGASNPFDGQFVIEEIVFN